MALAVAGCGSDDKKEPDTASSPHSTADKGKSPEGTPADEQPDPSVKLAELMGPKGILFTINSVERNSGGFVTVSGQIRNEGSSLFTERQPWKGNETEILRGSGNSVGGATLTDQVGKKRYYVLRDTDGRCLCSSGINPIKPGETIPVFMQFPAPPEGTEEVDFFLPTFPTAKLKISG
ncbi:hypothetical protein [Streptomyces sp. NPDC051219]|uniref:hypothetical protein n=1 Tax=Streptomyces sp. NPDC051219 TaxID=3155283 RepID=UPI00341466B0